MQCECNKYGGLLLADQINKKKNCVSLKLTTGKPRSKIYLGEGGSNGTQKQIRSCHATSLIMGLPKRAFIPSLDRSQKSYLGKAFFVGLFVTIRMTGVFRGNHF
jgi:hypothetical protein